MTTYANPANSHKLPSPMLAGEITFRRFKFDLSDANYAPTTATIVANDLLEIGVVPAGMKLVPHLGHAEVPQLDSNGTPTGDFAIGSATDPDALKGNQASETAVVMTGEDFLIVAGTAELGAKEANVPIYIKAVNASATNPKTGVIYLDAFFRPYTDDDADIT